MTDVKRGPGGLRLEFDLDDPETPVMVYLDRSSATYHCATTEWEIEGIDLTDEQRAFLIGYEAEADRVYTLARKVF